MSVEKLRDDKGSTPSATRSEVRFPAYSLADSVYVAKMIHERGGGSATAERLISYLGYKSTNNGAYLARIGAARTFELVAKNGNLFIPTPLAQRIFSPVYPSDAKQALVESFLAVPLFKQVYENFKGKELPAEFGMKNALRHQFGVVTSRVDLAYRVLMESADTAGFFETRLGARTHLIIPAIGVSTAPQRPSAEDYSAALGGGGGSGDGTGDPPDRNENALRGLRDDSGSKLADVKAVYVSTLIKLFEEKSAKGNLDEKLMERIERLLDSQ